MGLSVPVPVPVLSIVTVLVFVSGFLLLYIKRWGAAEKHSGDSEEGRAARVNRPGSLAGRFLLCLPCAAASFLLLPLLAAALLLPSSCWLAAACCLLACLFDSWKKTSA